MSTAALIAADFVKSPFDHQLTEFERHCDAPARAKAWTMRTGKSKATIDKACHLYRRGKIDGVLIFAPNGVHANWIEREVPAHCWPNVPTLSLVWRSSVAGSKAVKSLPKREQAAWHAEQKEWWARLAKVKTDPRLMFLAVNTESMIRKDVRKAVARFINNRKIFVVFDESDDFGTPGSQRTKMARALARRCAFREILSGTIVDGSPLHAFAQYELLEKGALGFDRYEDFKDRYTITEEAYGHGGRVYPKIVGFQNEDELRERMARFTSVVLRDDCKDMPELVPTERRITPTEEQMRIYRDLHNSFVIDLEAGQISIGERAPRFQKMQQVFSGFIIDENKKVRTIPGGNPRLDALADEVFLSPGKVVIWCQFQRDIDLVVQRLLADGFEVAQYHGRVSDKRKAEALQTFREDKGIKPLVGHAQSGGRGLDMSVASKIIWYSHTWRARIRKQALERATKIGGRNIEVMDLIAPGPDQYILQTVNNRIDIADAIAGTGMREFLKGIAL